MSKQIVAMQAVVDQAAVNSQCVCGNTDRYWVHQRPRLMPGLLKQ